MIAVTPAASLAQGDDDLAGTYAIWLVRIGGPDAARCLPELPQDS